MQVRLATTIAALAALLALAGCPEPSDDDTTGADDDTTADDDDTEPDDDDSAGDDDTGPDDDDSGPDVCVDDGMEQDDSLAAASIVPGGSYPGLVACPADEDWFAALVLDGQTITAGVIFDDSEGDIDLALYDATATLLDSSTSSTDSEQVSFPVTVSGLYYVQAVLVADAGAAGNGYDLDVAVAASPSCLPDALEPNDDMGTAASIGDGFVPDLNACPTDDDWYEVYAAIGDTLTVDVLFDDDDGDIDLFLLDDAGGPVMSSTSTDDDEDVAFAPVVSGTYYLQVTLAADAGTPGNEYDLVVFGTSSATCASDAMEPNDSSSTAAPVGAGSYPSLHACDTDDDWYEVSLSAGESLDVDLLFSNAEGNVDATLYDAAGAPLAAATSLDDDESLGWTSTIGGVVRLQVELVTDLGAVPGNDYDMVVATSGGAPCTADAFEPNDAIGTPTILATGTYPGLSACPTDSDWYRLFSNPTETIVIEALFDSGEGNVDLYVYDVTSTLLDSSTGTDDDEQVTWIAPASMEIFVEIVLASDAGSVPGTEYTFAATKLAPCVPDALEPNEDSFNATTAPPPYSQPGLTLCGPVDQDWFLLPAMAVNTMIEAQAVFNVSDGEVAIYLYDPFGNLVADSTGAAGIANVWSYVANGGAWTVQVLMVSDAGLPGVPYSISISVGPAPSTCVDDYLEPNDSTATAADIMSVSYGALTACPSEADWYAFDADAGDVIDLGLVFNHSEGDIDLHLYDGSVGLLVSSTSTDDDEDLTWTVAADGSFLVEVELANDIGGIPGNWYDMTLAGATTACLPDLFEPNDTSGDAAPISLGVHLAQTICPGDEDWYSFDLAELQTLTLDVGFGPTEGNVDGFLWDPTLSTVVASGTNLVGNETISYVVPETDTYYLQVVLVSDAGPLPGNVYDLDIAAGLYFVCSPDSFEPNEDIGHPAPIWSGTHPNLTICEDEPDWYSIPVNASEQVDIEITWTTAEGEIDVNLYDPTGALVGSAATTGSPELLAQPAALSGDYLVEVYMVADAGPSTGATYTMALQTIPGYCPPDAWESNDAAVGAQAMAPGSYGSLTACYDVDDWYSLPLSPGETIIAEAFFEHAEGDLNLALYNGVGSLMAASNSTNDDEALYFTVGTSDTYFVVVNLAGDAGPAAGNRYGLDVEVYEATCPVDSFEPNNSSGAAVAITPPLMTGLGGCSDDDWYSIPVTAGTPLDVWILFEDNQGDLDLYLYDSAATLLASSVSLDDDERIEWTPTATGTLYARVDMTADAGPSSGNAYDLVVLGPSYSACPDDVAEPNDSLAAAFPIGAGGPAPLFVCPSDDDWFEFVAYPGETIDALVEFADSQGDVDVALYDSAGALLASSASSDDDEQVTWTVVDADYYLLQVELASDAGSPGNDYLLTLTLN